MVKNDEDFKVYRESVFECLFKKADANNDGKVSEKEFEVWRDKTSGLSWIEKAPLYWSVVTSWCNCDCDSSSISWEDVHGTEPTCLGSRMLVDQAHQRLCK